MVSSGFSFTSISIGNILKRKPTLTKKSILLGTCVFSLLYSYLKLPYSTAKQTRLNAQIQIKSKTACLNWKSSQRFIIWYCGVKISSETDVQFVTINDGVLRDCGGCLKKRVVLTRVRLFFGIIKLTKFLSDSFC